jgi:hypothetical protein
VPIALILAIDNEILIVSFLRLARLDHQSTTASRFPSSGANFEAQKITNSSKPNTSFLHRSTTTSRQLPSLPRLSLEIPTQ